MAHSFVMAFDREVDAFCAYLARYPQSTTLLIDTYDSIEGAHAAMAAMERTGIRARAVRLDSGDLEGLSRAVRQALDQGGYPDVQIFVSGDLDEHRVRALLSHGAPIDAFGVGTRMGTSADHPYLAVVYKLVEFAGEGRIKLSAGKVTLPGRKQIHRGAGADVLALFDEPAPYSTRPLLSPWMLGGRRSRATEALSTAQSRARTARGAVTGASPREVQLSVGLARQAAAAATRHRV